MCKAFSCLIERNGKVHWKLGMDSHSDIVGLAGLNDTEADRNKLSFARVEITPKNNDYRHPDNWSLHIDEQAQPPWWSPTHEAKCWKAHREWCAQLYKILDTEKEVVNPFTDITPPTEITDQHIKLLKDWNSVGDSVWDSVRNSVGNSVFDSIGDSIGDSVGYSVSNSVYAQIGSLFKLDRASWKYTEDLPETPDYPFQAAVDLWNLGLVPSFDGEIWRLHGGPKAEVLWSGKFKT